MLCCGYTLTDFPISIRLTSLALWQSNDCPSASKATLMNMDKYFMWIIMNDCVTTTKQSTTKPCAYFLGYTVHVTSWIQIKDRSIGMHQIISSFSIKETVANCYQLGMAVKWKDIQMPIRFDDTTKTHVINLVALWGLNTMKGLQRQYWYVSIDEEIYISK